METLLDARQTALALPWTALVDAIQALLRADPVHVPERIVMPTAGGAVLFVMPATDGRVAMTKLITFTPGNAGSGTPTIQGDVTVFDVASGRRRLILDGPTVGAGVQGRAHLEAFAAVLGVQRFLVASRSVQSCQRLVDFARQRGLRADVAHDANAALGECPLAATCTPADGVVLHAPPPADGFIAAVGAFTPRMVELDAGMCRDLAERGRIVVDTPDARHEAGDLLQAGIAVARLPTLQDVVRGGHPGRRGPVLFKSCGWAGWDLAAAQLALCAH